MKRRRRGWSPDNHAYQHRSPDPTKIEIATATSTAALFFLFLFIQRCKIQMSSLNNIGKKARDSNTYCTPRHITTSLQKWALVTKQKFASPLDFDPSYQAYWSRKTRDAVFGARTNALDTKFTGFSFCHPIYCDYLLHSLVEHALQSTNSLNKLQQHSYSSLTGLVGVRTGT